MYFGYVSVSEQPKTWARKHDSFASEEWIIAQVKWGPRWQFRGRNHIEITTYGQEGNRTVRVKIQAACTYSAGRIHRIDVFHIHLES
jgi:hypothetical protein